MFPDDVGIAIRDQLLDGVVAGLGDQDAVAAIGRYTGRSVEPFFDGPQVAENAAVEAQQLQPVVAAVGHDHPAPSSTASPCGSLNWPGPLPVLP